MINEHDIEAFKDMKPVREKPILFNSEMVRAILDGRKTQTRRVVKSKHVITHIQHVNKDFWMVDYGEISKIAGDTIKCPYGQIGDQLWVRETFVHQNDIALKDLIIADGDYNEFLFYRADSDKFDGKVKWNPSIFMPRWASRIQLRIKDIRVERLQDISEDDALKEGVKSTAVVNDNGDDYSGLYACEKFMSLWKKINGEKSWDDNPWVWVVEFERIKP